MKRVIKDPFKVPGTTWSRLIRNPWVVGAGVAATVIAVDRVKARKKRADQEDGDNRQ